MNRDELLEACFGRPGLPSGQKIFETTEGAHVLSHVDLFYRRVVVHRTVAPGPGIQDASVMLTVAAIGNVCTDPAHRHRGYAHLNVLAAHAEAATHRNVRFAALFAGPELYSFYEELGYLLPVGGPPAFMVCPLPYQVLVTPPNAAGLEAVWEERFDEWPEGRIQIVETW